VTHARPFTFASCPLEERYPSHDEYVNAAAAAANGLVRDRLLLEEDAPATVKKAQDAPVGK
jgi:Alpha/beta hydrolase domain